MKRRVLLLATAAPRVLCAQTAARRFRIGILAIGSGGPSPQHVALVDGLREQGLVEGQNIELVTRWAAGLDELPRSAAELAAERVDAIVTGNNVTTHAAVAATTSTPIVMAIGVDPVKNGLIDSFARPGRNVTGLVNDASQDMHGKHLSLLKELVPGLRRVAILVQEGIGEDMSLIRAAMRQLGLQIVPVAKLQQLPDLEAVFSHARRGGAQGYLGIGGSIVFRARQRVAALALAERLPGVHWSADYVDAGCLVSYGVDLLAQYRRVAWYLARILRGDKAAELAVELPSRFEMAINLATARALGIVVPPSLLVRADKVVS